MNLLAVLMLALQDEKIDWKSSYDEGYHAAQKEKKLLAVHWISDH